MVFLGFNEISKKDNFIYYRNEYAGKADFSLIADKKASVRFEGTVEIKPTGERDISIKLLDTIDYPYIPIMKVLKAEILKIEQEGFIS